MAWGLFVGLAFLCIGFATDRKDKQKLIIKVTVLVCGMLCLSGFFGALFINKNLWYVAPMGYGYGSMIICIQMMRLKLAD